MSYITVTTWTMKPGADRDAAVAVARDKHMPVLKSLGVTRQNLVEISDTESIVVSEWPDQETRDRAMAKIAEIRSAITEEALTDLTGEMKGEVLVSL